MSKKRNRCMGLCKNSKRCKKKSSEKFCSVHAFNKLCTICLDTCKVGNYRKLKCSHVFCKRCIYEWVITNPTCPCCRTYVTNCDFNLAFNYNLTHGNIINVYSHTIYIPSGILSEFISEYTQFNQWISETTWNSIKNLFNRKCKQIYNQRLSSTIYTYMTLADYTNRFSIEYPHISYTIQNNNQNNCKIIDRYNIKIN